MKFIRFIKALYFRNAVFYIASALVVIFAFGHFFHFAFILGQFLLFLFLLALLADLIIVFLSKGTFRASRVLPEKLSNGDENVVYIKLINNLNFTAFISVIDEFPDQFQLRDTSYRIRLKSKSKKTISYSLFPKERGEYHFGRLNIYISSPLQLISRRMIFDQGAMVPVYPSFLQMRKYELLAISNKLDEYGIKRMRKIGQSSEFDQIKNYVPGDDYRLINWNATARKNDLMVNQFQDEKSQPVYSVIDMGRVMKMPFNGMTLLDYAINTSLVISNIAMLKDDKAGIITFSQKVNAILPADRKKIQMLKILELLYNQETDFKEPSYEALTATILTKLNQRSLILLYTNFESLTSLKRQMEYFKRIAKKHLLVVIFFENTELFKKLEETPSNLEQIYIKTIAEKFVYEKKQIVKELQNYGILSILSSPENLTVNTINKYIEIKAKSLI